MTVTVSAGRLKGRVRQTNQRPATVRRLAASRRAYDARRRALVEDPTERAALRMTRALVKRDPCSLGIVPTCHSQIAADHIVPLDSGGANRADNLTSACRACNAAKKRKSLLFALLDRKDS